MSSTQAAFQIHRLIIFCQTEGWSRSTKTSSMRTTSRPRNGNLRVTHHPLSQEKRKALKMMRPDNFLFNKTCFAFSTSSVKCNQRQPFPQRHTTNEQLSVERDRSRWCTVLFTRHHNRASGLWTQTITINPAGFLETRAHRIDFTILFILATPLQWTNWLWEVRGGRWRRHHSPSLGTHYVSTLGQACWERGCRTYWSG